MTLRVLHAIDRARAVVVGAGLAPSGAALHTDPKYTDVIYFDTPDNYDAHSEGRFGLDAADDMLHEKPFRNFAEGDSKVQRLQAPSSPLQRPQAPPKPRVLPTLASAEEVAAGRTLSQGAQMLWQLAHELAREDVLRESITKKRTLLPTHTVIFLPAVLMAAAVGYSERHTHRLVAELERAGLLHARGYVMKVGNLWRYAGTLWAVALKPNPTRPRVRWFDFQQSWRPNFAEDYYAEKGAFRTVEEIMSKPFTCDERIRECVALARKWVADAKNPSPPVEGGYDMRPVRTLQAVADALPGLIGMHPRQRHEAVSVLATDLAHALNEPGRFRQHCAAIYAALKAEIELRPGLEALALQVRRIAIDLSESTPWKKPGAVLAKRLRPT